MVDLRNVQALTGQGVNELRSVPEESRTVQLRKALKAFVSGSSPERTANESPEFQAGREYMMSCLVTSAKQALLASSLAVYKSLT